MIKRREKTKREDLHLGIEIFEKRYQAKDFNGQLMAEYSNMAVKTTRYAHFCISIIYIVNFIIIVVYMLMKNITIFFLFQINNNRNVDRHLRLFMAINTHTVNSNRTKVGPILRPHTIRLAPCRM